MKVNRESMRLYAVTDRSWLNGSSVAEQVEKAIKGGATFIQLREKNLSFDEFVREAKAIKVITDRYKIPFVINDNVDVAVAVDSDGVHVGQGDEGILEARKRLGNNKIIGVSTHNLKEALEAERSGADYLGVGAIYTTSTKSDANAVSCIELENICSNVKIPVVAIGGISKNNIIELKGTNISGVAVISAIFAEENIEEASRELFSLSKEVCQ